MLNYKCFKINKNQRLFSAAIKNFSLNSNLIMQNFHLKCFSKELDQALSNSYETITKLESKNTGRSCSNTK